MIDSKVKIAKECPLRDESGEITASSFVRIMWVIAGFISMSIGIIGIFLPIVPTTSPLLLAAFCFARGSNKMNAWLLSHKTLGPPIRNWRKYGAISTIAKVQAIIMMGFSVILVWFIGLSLWIILAQAITLTLVAIFLVTRPTPPR